MRPLSPLGGEPCDVLLLPLLKGNLRRRSIVKALAARPANNQKPKSDQWTVKLSGLIKQKV